LTGDIAYSGALDEYKAAETFLARLKEEFKQLDCAINAVLMVPGNHDCVLKPEDTVRSIVINSIVADVKKASDPAVVDACVKPQQNFFAFRNTLCDLQPKFDQPLWTEYEIIVDRKPVRISAINAAWMSRIPEVPGQLVFPADEFEDILLEPCAARIAMIHHPLNWYAQSSYHELRKRLRTHCSIVLSGHEHTGAISSIAETNTGDILSIEALALQPDSASEPSGFSLTVLDVAAETVEVSPYTIHKGVAVPGDVTCTHLAASATTPAEGSELTEAFVELISNPGGSFIHPDRESIHLDDIFVFPELRALDAVEGDRRIQQPRDAEAVLLDKPLETRAILLAEEKGGKTSLLFSLFKRIHAAGLWPLYICTNRLARREVEDIGRLLSRRAAEQYRNPASFSSAPPSRKILLLDDLEHLPGGAKALRAFVERVAGEFSGIIATANRGFELQEVLLPDATTALRGFRRYELARFGHVLRHRLIRKWCENGNWTAVSDLDRDVHAAEDLLDKVLGKNLAPALPMYLLILLQSWSQQQQGEIQNSSFARYYEYLMTRSLVRTPGFGRDEYDELFNYLSQLAWFFWDSNIECATYSELVSFNTVFCRKFATVDLDRRLELLMSARLLSKIGDGYEFAYPYVFFFFLGRWLARNLSDDAVRERVKECAQRLDNRKNASAVLFLSYHSNDRWIIETIADALLRCMPPCQAADLDEDVRFVNELADNSATVLIEAPNVERNQVNERKMRDGLELIDEEEDYRDADESEDDLDSTVALLRRMQLLFATAEILGQIIRNYYGSLERDVKEENLRQVMEAPLRVVRWIFEAVGRDSDSFVLLMEEAIRDSRTSLSANELRGAARDLAYNLLGIIATGLILRGASWVASRRIQEDVEKVVSEDSTVGRRLIQAGTRLILPGEIAHDQIRRLARDLRNNPFAFKILQSIGVRHLHLFFVPTRDRQKLCDALRIEFKTSSFIDFATKDTKLFPS
jgi:hypothetical protein